MNRLILILTLCLSAMTAFAQEYLSSSDRLSNDYRNEVQDIPIIRSINGGTIIIPVFDESCPESIKAPFEYACKIVEEYLPPCTPITVKVSTKKIVNPQTPVISTFKALSYEHFGDVSAFKNTPMTMIKGVTLGEYSIGVDKSFLTSIPDVNFLTEKPDIEICYNSYRLSELSYSLDSNPGEKYDFVSIAIRDLLKGFGLFSTFKYDRNKKELNNPDAPMIPFEHKINQALGPDNTPAQKLINATQGEIILSEESTSRSLKLYAPTTWAAGKSLSFFIPQADCNISKVLSYDFCRGMATRSLQDDYGQFVFTDLLGWKINFLVGNDTPTTGYGGSTALLMPYNGSISFANSDKYGLKYSLPYDNFCKSRKQSISSEIPQEVVEYFEQFSLFPGDMDDSARISILKKDGTWDDVCYLPIPTYIGNVKMSDLEFHCNESEYARTVDGYFRAKLASVKRTGEFLTYTSTFFVIDYLPQKINLRAKVGFKQLDLGPIKPQNADIQDSNTAKKIATIYFSNLEGTERIILERLREGDRIPSKIEVPDIRCGFYETEIDCTTTFTAVAYNKNGHQRGEPLRVEPIVIFNPSQIIITQERNKIIVHTENNSVVTYDYSIQPLNIDISAVTFSGSTDGTIDISNLQSGIYVVTVTDRQSGLTNSLKFKK